MSQQYMGPQFNIPAKSPLKTNQVIICLSNGANTLRSLPIERQKSFCGHSLGDSETPCNSLPCTARIAHLAEAAAQCGQADIFAYLWDTFLAPRGGTSIPWPCLKTAAFQGSIPLAQTYWTRDPACFKTIGPRSLHPPSGVKKRPLQIETAIRSDRFEYIDFMLAHGADINNADGSPPGNDILRMVLRCAVNDATTLTRIRFLVSRGAKAAGSGALQDAVAADNIALTTCLLDSGADVNHVVEPEKTSLLMVAAREGYRDMVELLLDRGANIELVDREGKNAIAIADRSGHESIVRLLQARVRTGTALKTVT